MSITTVPTNKSHRNHIQHQYSNSLSCRPFIPRIREKTLLQFPIPTKRRIDPSGEGDLSLTCTLHRAAWSYAVSSRLCIHERIVKMWLPSESGRTRQWVRTAAKRSAGARLDDASVTWPAAAPDGRLRRSGGRRASVTSMWTNRTDGEPSLCLCRAGLPTNTRWIRVGGTVTVRNTERGGSQDGVVETRHLEK